MNLIPDEIRHLEAIPILIQPQILLPFDELKPIHLTEPAHLQLIDDVRFGDGYFGFHFNWLTEHRAKRKDIPRLPYINSTGCIARVTEEKPHEEGGSNVKIKGVYRYRVAKFLATDKPYPVAAFKFFKDVFHDGWEEEAQKLCDEICLINQRAWNKFLGKFLDLSKRKGMFLMKPDPYFLSFMAAPLFSGDTAFFLKCLQYNSVIGRLEYALEQMKEFEAAVEDNIERTNLIEPFLKLPNNRSNPDLS